MCKYLPKKIIIFTKKILLNVIAYYVEVKNGSE